MHEYCRALVVKGYSKRFWINTCIHFMCCLSACILKTTKNIVSSIYRLVMYINTRKLALELAIIYVQWDLVLPFLDHFFPVVDGLSDVS